MFIYAGRSRIEILDLGRWINDTTVEMQLLHTFKTGLVETLTGGRKTDRGNSLDQEQRTEDRVICNRIRSVMVSVFGSQWDYGGPWNVRYRFGMGSKPSKC